MPLTARGVAVGLAAVVLYLAGAIWGYPVLRAIAGMSGAAIVVALLVTVVPLRASVAREIYPHRVERGKPALATLIVRNQTQVRQGAFVAGDRIGDRRHEVPVRGLPSRGMATYRYALPTTRRGRVRVGPLTVRRGDALGLARRDTAASGTAELWVHPRRHLARAASGVRARHHHEGPLPRHGLSGSMELRAIREYMPGDAPRFLHWRASARVQRLMVRDQVDPAQPHCVVILDTDASALSPAAFEEAVEVVASLAHAAVAHGHPTRLRTTGGLDLSVEGKPVGGRVLLDALCEVEQSRHPTPESMGDLTRKLRLGGWLALVTGGGQAAVSATAPLRRYFAPFVIFDMGRSPMDEIPGVTVVRSTDAADAIGRWNALVAP